MSPIAGVLIRISALSPEPDLSIRMTLKMRFAKLVNWLYFQMLLHPLMCASNYMFININFNFNFNHSTRANCLSVEIGCEVISLADGSFLLVCLSNV